ncbi:ribonuclease P protein subunit p30 [Armigeres subalbatus]|uniref:ribonuclease P protein subunit p30 n=1 Tax=Armigeres subalbatus TaxID=124917 RepID=UPI002ED3BB78
MNKFTGFSDLCIPYNNAPQELLGILNELVELGYKNVAIEQIYDHDSCDKKGDTIPAPIDLKPLSEKLNGRLILLNRLTIIYSENTITLITNRSLNLRGYHLVAVIPRTEDAFQHACQSMQCDIVSYNSSTVRCKMSRKSYFVAVNRNIMFEIKYAPAITNSNDRKDIINRAHKYHSYGKSKNVVISSEARNRFQIRGPYDIANLGLILGLSEEQSKNAILALPRKVLINAETRRHGKAGVVVSMRQNAIDSDDYTDSEVDEPISDSDEKDSEEITEYENMMDENQEPPRKISKII